jgi:murein DD-endopeptidase MepM/ murein hydrolase activator NlpD
MPKFSYLLILSFVVSSCATQPQTSPSDIPATPQNVAAQTSALNHDQVVVNKENNSIKINTDQDQTKKKHLKPMFDWPVWEARMTRGFLPHGTKKRRRPHKGIDLAAPRGSAVMAAQDAVVIYTGSGFKGYGKMIMIESVDSRDGGNWATLYGHLDKILVYEGKKVKQGEVIEALGNTGRSSGPHLHFEIRRLDGPIDPLPLLPAGEALTNDVDNGAVEE